MAVNTSISNPPKMFEPYHEWKNEVMIWSEFIVDKIPTTKQGMALFLSLEGDARKAAAKVVLADMKTADGLTKVLTELDRFFLKDKDRAAFLAYDKFNAFRRPQGMSMRDFLIKFELLKNTCISHEFPIPDKIAAHQMLVSANISPQKKDIIVSTLTKFTPDDMRTKLLCVFSEDVTPALHESFDDVMKIEPVVAGTSSGEVAYVGSNGGYNRNFRGGRRPNYRGRGNGRKPNQFRQTQGIALQRNVCDEDGNVTTCGFCGSIYHYIGKCPDKSRQQSSEARRGGYNL